jgi:O-glycosyl hydrolase
MQRQRAWYWISYAFVFCLLTQFLVACNNPTPTIVKLDPTAPYTFEGWGTSLAWWAEVVGSWPDAKRAALEKALFNPEAGLGLNIVRYNFGAGTPTDNTCGGFRPFGSIPTYEPIPSNNFVLDPNQDKAQLAVLKDAKGIIMPSEAIFEGFANSAPSWMLENGCTKGNGAGNNLKAPVVDPVTQVTYEQDYANYLATIIKQFHDNTAFGQTTFRTVAPFNEPDGTWWTPKNTQEGMYVDLDQQKRVIQDLYAALKANGALSYTSISANDDNSIDNAVTDYSHYDQTIYDQTILSHISQLNTHSYNGTKLNDFYQLGKQQGKPIWMSEYTTDGTDGLSRDPKCRFTDKDHTSTQDMTGPLSLSCRILLDMNNMHPGTWSYWQAVESFDDPKNAYGLLQTSFQQSNPSCPSNPSSPFCFTKQYYALWQYSHFIRPGYQIINSGDANSLAAFDPASHTLVIVTTNDNPSTTRDITYDLSNFTPVSEPITSYTTTADTRVNATPTPSSFSGSGTQFMAHVPSQSITTYVIHNISVLSSGNPGTTTENPLGKVDWTKVVTEADLGCNDTTLGHVGPNLGVEVDEKQFADVTGDGKKEAFVAVACVASTSSWPDRLEVFDGASDPAHPRRIATLLDYQDGTDELGLRMGSNFGIPQSITVTGRTVTVVSHGYAPTDGLCCPSWQITDTFTWNGSGFTRGSRSVVQAKAP